MDRMAYANGQSIRRAMAETNNQQGKIKLSFTMYMFDKLGLDGSSYATLPLDSRTRIKLPQQKNDVLKSASSKMEVG